MMRQKVTVVGIGYVGLGVGVMLSARHDVTMLDVDRKIGLFLQCHDERGKNFLKKRRSIVINAYFCATIPRPIATWPI